MLRTTLATLMVGLCTVAAPAQPQTMVLQDGPVVAAGTPENQFGWFDGIVDRFARDLGLDEAQRTRFDELAETHRRRMQEMSERWREIREATRAGDQERAAELRKGWSRGPDPGGVMADLLEDAEPLLRDDQLDKLFEMQDRMATQRRQRDLLRRVMTSLPEELALDDTQRAQWDDFLTEARERRREHWQSIRPLTEELREAEAAGDQERVDELRRQIGEAQPDQEQMIAEFLEQLEPLLRDDQKAVLKGFRREFGLGEQPKDASGPSDVRIVLRAARRVKLNSTQREAFQKIQRDAMQARREARRHDRAAQAELATQVKKQIVELLDAAQTREFEEQLQRLDRRGRGSRGRAPTQETP